VARINLTIPDSLYERLELVRDRVNVSKVCATALAKELDMLDTTTSAPEDQRVQRLVQRVLRQRENRDRWYLRGKQDGADWAADRASVDELGMMDEQWSDESIAECSELDEIDEDEYPTLNAQELLDKWIATDRKDSIHVRDADVDWHAYLQGWFHGARDLWRNAKPALSM
jgi:hypothetical protein